MIFKKRKLWGGGIILKNIGDSGARKLKAEVDPEGSDHNESSGDS